MTHLIEDTPGTETVAGPRWAGRLGARLRRASLFGAGVAAALFAVIVYGALFPGPAPLTTADVRDSIASALASQTPAPAFSEEAYAAVRPSLVLIETELAGDPGGATNGLGSGVIIDDQGDTLTSLHVVAHATSIKLTFADGTESNATITVQRPDQDTAVLHADTLPANFMPATLGNPRAAHIGSEAFAVGNPLGLYGSVTAGVISGLDRSFQLPNTDQVLHGLIQIDAAVNPGNSGGPLVDRDGRVLGIVAALINPTKQDVFIGIGLAVPIDAAGGAAGLPQY
jgi:S1-C subfamily serine protease